MSLPTTQTFQQVETFLHDKRFPEALHLLKTLDTSSLKGEEYGYYCILLTEAGLNVGEYFESCIDKAIETFRFSSDAEKFAKAKFLKGWLLSSVGKHHEAKEILLEAYANYLRCKNLKSAARVLNWLSYSAFQTGNIEAATDNLRRCIDIYSNLGESTIATKVGHNLAKTFYATGSLQQSLSAFKEHHPAASTHDEKALLLYYVMSAVPHALKGDIFTSKRTIKEAKPYLDKYIHEKAIYYENLGLILILDGDYAGAETALKEGLRISLEIAPESALVSQIKRLFGDLYIAMSNVGLDSRLHGNDKEPPIDKHASFLRRQESSKPSFLRKQETSDVSFLRRQEASDPSFLRRQETSIALAEQYASEALAVAEKINERVEIAACYRIFAQIEQYQATPTASCEAPTIPTTSGGAPSKAREWYKKAIDLFNLIGSRYELAVTRFLAATSGLYSNGERMAMLYLAREYFESEEVHHYVEKIDAALKAAPTVHRPIRKPSPACPTIIAVNPQMKKLIALAEHVAESEMTVLLTGETGTGKDILARYIHYLSERSGEFVAVNAAAIPETMIESELFGYRKGSFTGAMYDRAGLFEQADKGTFYLDEISDSSPEFQAKLLRVLETRCTRRLGENKTRQVAFRLIAASNHDLHQRMRDNLFRLDLYHRLNEICIHLPPLDDRKDDIPALVRHFLTFAGFSLTDGNESEVEQLGKTLSHRTWPGNVRELEHEVKRLWAHAKGDVSRMIELTLDSSSKSKPEFLLQLLEMHNWNRRRVARIMGVSEGTIRIWIKKFGLTRQ
jgi:DNA-binding NtrC family response regulator/tetratricopeptide (TPR) repeat protein